MPFDDNPIVDEASKNSNASVTAVIGLFSQKNGFICREEIPDFGVDEDVELIVNNQAISKKFAIQIKSVEKAKIIRKDNTQFVSLQFKTSRLGYLLRRPPAYGIIIIYDDSTKIVYYEYAEEVHKRLNNQFGNDSWKNIEKPSINIPTENILNTEVVITIHKKMIDRHKNNQFMLSAYGQKYDIPTFDDNIILNEIDYKNPQVISEYLKDYGLLMMDYKEFHSLQHLIKELSFSEVESSKELLLIAAIVNCETGNLLDADFYLQKTELRDDYNDTQQDCQSFTRFKIDFAFGKFDNKIYLSNLENQLETIQGQYNFLIIKINIIYIRLLISLDDRILDENIISEIENVFDIISKSDINKGKKFNLINFHALNLHTYSMSLFIEKIGNYKIRERMNLHTPEDDRISDANKIVQILSLPTKYSLEALDYAENNNDKYVLASSLYQLSHYFFMLQFNIAIVDTIPNLTSSIKKLYEINLNYSFRAYNEFIKLSINKDAYNALVIAYELSCLYFEIYKEVIGPNKLDEIEKKIKLIEKQLGLIEYKSIVKQAFSKKNNIKNIDSQEFLNISETELEFAAQRLVSAIGLPQERINNVLIDMKNSRFFYNNRQSDSLELLQDLKHTQSLETYYKAEPNYAIRCNKCGFQTIKNKDIKKLLSVFDYHKC